MLVVEYVHQDLPTPFTITDPQQVEALEFSFAETKRREKREEKGQNGSFQSGFWNHKQSLNIQAS